MLLLELLDDGLELLLVLILLLLYFRIQRLGLFLRILPPILGNLGDLVSYLPPQLYLLEVFGGETGDDLVNIIELNILTNILRLAVVAKEAEDHDG